MVTARELEEWKSRRGKTVPFTEEVGYSKKFRLKTGYKWNGTKLTQDHLHCPCGECGHKYQADCERAGNGRFPCDCSNEVCT